MYIPDITERFPEGYNGIDMTSSYFGEPIDHTLALGYSEIQNDSEIIETNTTPRLFEIGRSYRKVGVYGGITTYIVKEIDRENNQILLAEEWIDVDGSGIRPAEWHKLSKDLEGNEKALEWESEDFGPIYINA